MINWSGIFPAITTKFTVNDELDLDLFGRNVEAQIKAGVSGLIVGGTLGEASVLSQEEKITLVDYTLEKVDGRVPVVLNIAEGATREAIRIAKEASTMGLSGLMMLPPMRYKSDHRETVEYFKAVAGETDLQIMIYNNPVDYKVEVTLDMFDELSVCRNIDAIKESTRDVVNITRLINRFGDRYSVMCGVDPLAMESFVLGAKGWVAGLVCAFPEETVTLFDLVLEGRMAEAVALNRWFMPLLELDIHAKLVQYIKLAEAEAGLGSEYVRAPRLTLTGEERKRVLDVIRTGIRNRPVLPATKSRLHSTVV